MSEQNLREKFEEIMKANNISTGKYFNGEYVLKSVRSKWDNFKKENIDMNKIETSALETQIGGDHYKKLAIQPMEYSMANGLDACQHTAIKYITRFRDKGGIADLDKAIHCIEMLKEFEIKKQQSKK